MYFTWPRCYINNISKGERASQPTMFKAITTFFNNINEQAAQYETKRPEQTFATVEDAYQAGCEENVVFNAVMKTGQIVAVERAVQGAQDIADELF